jgi:DNA gyrase subunit A
MGLADPNASLITVTESGFAKRSEFSEWATKGRNTQGVKVMQQTEAKGDLVAALTVNAEDHIFAVTANGVVLRTKVSDFTAKGRVTQGNRLKKLDDGDTVVGVARLSAATMAEIEIAAGVGDVSEADPETDENVGEDE